MNILEIRDLDSGYGKALILQDLSIDVKEGGFTAIIGPNGAGKTTLLRTIFSLCDLYKGTISFRGKDITRIKAENLSDIGLNYVPQEESIFPSLTVFENLRMGSVKEKSREKISSRLERVYNRFPVLEKRHGQSAGTLSGGERQMLAVGCALMTDPDLLLLDEPTAGLAPTLVEGLFQDIAKLNTEGRSLLLVEQNAKMALQYAHEAYILEGGRIKQHDDAANLLKSEEIIKHYLSV
ncbi:MAG: ABC transporter ATP-binding protein [Deltaproteobacteria bacterium]|nr:ABC transporter ATP-binding protein [Deltaproteobacteria bacterium]MBW1977532.1 ABC transporter ATP-binding protein [Deltaproteobacteria bacterium]MBW2046343.1 ABC transporter ATP-binding protein [Deltaproteobacteria bacterium]MBW2299575.1 ABC transporter ATP-binding protein [Deltaproteobacteria bacterium]